MARRGIDLFNYWIKIRDKKSGDVWKERNIRHPWNTSDTYIRQALDDDVKAINESGSLEAVSYGINKEEFTQKTLVGELTDNGRDGEEFEVMVGGRSLIDELYNPYRGNNVRIILQVLSNERP